MDILARLFRTATRASALACVACGGETSSPVVPATHPVIALDRSSLEWTVVAPTLVGPHPAAHRRESHGHPFGGTVRAILNEWTGEKWIEATDKLMGPSSAQYSAATRSATLSELSISKPGEHSLIVTGLGETPHVAVTVRP